MANKLVYVVEDDPDIRQLVCRTLHEYGLAAEGFGSGSSIRRAMTRCRPDLVVVDLGLPDIDGMALVRELWSKPQTGVIILTGRSSVPDRVVGLELGADDYIVKPFDPRELTARVISVLRRLELGRNGDGDQRGKATFSGWVFDPDTLTLTSPTGAVETLSTAEARLLLVFLKSPNRVLSRDQLLEPHQQSTDQPYDRSIDVCVSRLRKKLQSDPDGPPLIKTVYGAGYLLSSNPEWPEA